MKANIILFLLLASMSAKAADAVHASEEPHPSAVPTANEPIKVTNVWESAPAEFFGPVPEAWEAVPAPEIVSKEGPFPITGGKTAILVLQGYKLRHVRTAAGLLPGVFVREPQAEKAILADKTVSGVLERLIKESNAAASALCDLAAALEELTLYAKGPEQPEALPIPSIHPDEETGKNDARAAVPSKNIVVIPSKHKAAAHKDKGRKGAILKKDTE